MVKLFGVDIASEIAKNMGAGLLPATLIVVTTGTRTSGSLTSGKNPSEKTFSCRGIIEDYKETQFNDTSVLRGDRKVLLLGGTLQAGIVPKLGDKVKIEGFTFNVVNVNRDPASATYSLQVRG